MQVEDDDAESRASTSTMGAVLDKTWVNVVSVTCLMVSMFTDQDQVSLVQVTRPSLGWLF